MEIPPIPQNEQNLVTQKELSQQIINEYTEIMKLQNNEKTRAIKIALLEKIQEHQIKFPEDSKIFSLIKKSLENNLLP